MNRFVVRDVVAVIAQRGREERHEPDGVDAKFLDVIHTLREALEIAYAISIAVDEGAHMDLINDGVFVPAWFTLQWQFCLPTGGSRAEVNRIAIQARIRPVEGRIFFAIFYIRSRI